MGYGFLTAAGSDEGNTGGRDARDVPEMVRRVVRAADPELAIYDVRTIQEGMGQTVATRRFTTFLLSLFDSLGVVLIAIGLYGVLAEVALSLGATTHAMPPSIAQSRVRDATDTACWHGVARLEF